MNFRYKRFNASVLLNGVSGNDIANGNLLTIGNAPGQFQNITKDAYYNAWRPDAPSNTHPRIGYNTVGDTAITDRIIEDGSFLRLNNVTIGYDLPCMTKYNWITSYFGNTFNLLKVGLFRGFQIEFEC